MNIFTRKIKTTDWQELPINPVELYQTCPYREGYGYLRGIQEEVLHTWHNIRDQRDVVCKMNTGSGKTLTGLLMLYSKLVERKGPCLYVCPDLQLQDQTLNMAGLYGVPVCSFQKGSLNRFPDDFINSKKILVCTFQKLFNGKSIFTRDNIKIGAIILDDAHKCVDIAREQSTWRIPRNHPIAERLFRLFEKSLKFQLTGTFRRLEDGDPTVVMKVPYWSWMDEHDRIVELINEYVTNTCNDQEKSDEDICFKWPLMADNLLSYDCFIGGHWIEIAPIHAPYHDLQSFNEADHRYILSATFEDDFDLIRDLGIDKESILNPIVPTDRKDIGKRLILAPSRFDPTLPEDKIRNFISTFPAGGHNTVILVPSAPAAKVWEEIGAHVVHKDNIITALEQLDRSKGNFMVFVNRYDGIDLNGDLCRVLVIDGLPKYTSLQEFYAETRVDTLRSGKKAQIIEQGLGRAVRSGGDYSVIYLMGNNLLSFLGYQKNLDHFTPLTRAQLNLGLNLLDGESSNNSLKTIKEVTEFCLSNNPDWIQFHTQELRGVTQESLDENKIRRIEIADVERRGLAEFRLRAYQNAGEVILKNLVNSPGGTEKEKAWYYQFAAQLIYLGNKLLSNDLQAKACYITTSMLHPPAGHIYKKVLRKGSQPSIIKERLSRFDRPQDIAIYINELLNELQYSPDKKARSFEKSLNELGKFFGFGSQMPEDELGNGPDVIWCLSDGIYLILEAKSRSTHIEVSRENISQLLQSEQWFKNTYGESVEYYSVTLQPNEKKGKSVNINDNMRVISQESLALLHKNLTQFVAALQGTHPKAHMEEDLARLIEIHSFTPSKFRQTYLKKIR